jgi:hypothetical protein
MGIEEWRRKAQDRDQWRQIAQEATWWWWW